MIPLQRATSLWINRSPSCSAGGGVVQRELEAFRAGGDRGEWIVDLVHDARGERSDRGELLRLSEALLRLAPVRHVLADGDHVRHGPVVESHGDLGDAVGAHLAGGTRLHLKGLESSRGEDFIELATEHRRGLAVQDLEDRSPDRVLARHALHARLALPVPDGDAILAIDHVQPDGERVDDARRHPALSIDLLGALDDLGLELLRVRGLLQHGAPGCRPPWQRNACSSCDARGAAGARAPTVCRAASRIRASR